jgi:hypothetical protein
MVSFPSLKSQMESHVIFFTIGIGTGVSLASLGKEEAPRLRRLVLTGNPLLTLEQQAPHHLTIEL